jgi:hypothetical protein
MRRGLRPDLEDTYREDRAAMHRLAEMLQTIVKTPDKSIAQGHDSPVVQSAIR